MGAKNYSEEETNSLLHIQELRLQSVKVSEKV